MAHADLLLTHPGFSSFREGLARPRVSFKHPPQCCDRLSTVFAASDQILTAHGGYLVQPQEKMHITNCNVNLLKVLPVFSKLSLGLIVKLMKEYKEKN
jgi:hypothetical protein